MYQVFGIVNVALFNSPRGKLQLQQLDSPCNCNFLIWWKIYSWFWKKLPLIVLACVLKLEQISNKNRMYRIKKMWYIRFFVAEMNKNDFQKSDTPFKNIRYIPFVRWRTSGVTNRVRMQTPTPASLCKKNLLRQVKLPVGSSKKTWDRYDVGVSCALSLPRVSVPPVEARLRK